VRGCRIFTRFDQADRRAVLAGAVVLGSLAVVYPIISDQAARPLAVFVLPCLMTAVLGRWRPTVLVGMASLMVAIVLGLLGPLDGEALFARWLIIVLGVVMGALAAAARERQSGRLADLHETMALRAAFERALAPAPVPPPGFVAVTRYRSAEAGMHLGGDFLEAIALPDGRMAVLIGDVCGHGPREAAFGAALRAGWKSIALGGKQDPAEWVDALNNSFFQDGRIDTFATMCTGYLDRSEHVTRLCTVGHPPPIVLDRSPRPLGLSPAPPLGLGRCSAWMATELPWAGEPLLLYTDGLVENPNAHGEPRRWGEVGLLSWLRTHVPAGRLDEFADALVEAATDEREVRDDIAVLIVASDR
jgi:serine phosphatase RsbU (regulator of sigma subunit)